MPRVYFLFALLLPGLSACREGASGSAPSVRQVSRPAPVAPPEPSVAAVPPAAQQEMVGPVVETMDSGGYTYVKLDLPSRGAIWSAGPETKVAVGDTVSIGGGMLMREFESKTLSRTFDDIYFANALRVVSRGSGQASSPKAEKTLEAEQKIVVEKAEGGRTIAEVYASAESLSGEEVLVRGQVVKFNGGIMDTNWLHIRDGSGTTGTNDLTVTTDATVSVGAVIVVRGRLSTDKDFGAGYVYPVIVEEASIEE